MRSSEADNCPPAIAPPQLLSCAAYLLRAEAETPKAIPAQFKLEKSAYELYHFCAWGPRQ